MEKRDQRVRVDNQGELGCLDRRLEMRKLNVKLSPFVAWLHGFEIYQIFVVRALRKKLRGAGML